MLASVQALPIVNGVSPPASAYTYNNSAEMTQYTTPMGGSLGWAYDSYTYTSGITQREINSRTLTDSEASFTNTWSFNYQTMSPGTYHTSLDLLDNGAGSHKVYGSGMPITGLVLPISYAEESPGGSTTLLSKSFTGTQNSLARECLVGYRRLDAESRDIERAYHEHRPDHR